MIALVETYEVIHYFSPGWGEHFSQNTVLMPKLLNDYTLAFFNKHLKGTDSGLLNGPSSEYPEVEIKVKCD